MPGNSYEELEKKDVKVVELLKFYIDLLIKSIRRKLTFRQTFRNPWTSSASTFVQQGTFYYWYRTICDYSTPAGPDI